MSVPSTTCASTRLPFNSRSSCRRNPCTCSRWDSRPLSILRLQPYRPKSTEHQSCCKYNYNHSLSMLTREIHETDTRAQRSIVVLLDISVVRSLVRSFACCPRTRRITHTSPRAIPSSLSLACVGSLVSRVGVSSLESDGDGCSNQVLYQRRGRRPILQPCRLGVRPSSRSLTRRRVQQPSSPSVLVR